MSVSGSSETMREWRELGSDELLGDAVVEECEQRVEVAGDVEDAHRFLVDAAVRPSSGSRRTPRTCRSRREA